MEHTIYELLWIFLVYSFLGWCLEEITFSLISSKFVNRGFLNGPFCPVYGFGAVAFVLFLTPLQLNPLAVFLGAAFSATILELITGVILEKLFRSRWWDYSDKPFNFNGHICLEAGLEWGLAGLIIVYLIQPPLMVLLSWIPSLVGSVVASLVLIVIILDFIITLASLSNIFHKQKIIDETGDKIRDLSDALGKNIYDSAQSAIDFKNRSLNEIAILKQKRRDALDKKVFGYERIRKAFPKLRSLKAIKKSKK